MPKDQLPVISGSDAHQIKDVLRMKPGDKLEILDGAGGVYLAEIEQMGKEKIGCRIVESRHLDAERRIKVTLAQSLPKAKKMELIIQKCTELGVYRIIPLLSERSIANKEKPERWQKIAKEAAEQSGRSSIPEISPLTSFKNLLQQKKDFELALIPWELEKEKTLKSILPQQPPASLLIIIGPEGGFSQKEIELAQDAGITSVSLGQNILRTETAGMAIMAMLNYAYGQ